MTIIIGGDDDHPDLPPDLPPPEQRPPMDPRVRKRRIEVARSVGRRRLWIALGIGAVIALVVAVLAVFTSSLFAVRTVDVTGATYTTKGELQPIIDDLKGEPVLTVDIAKARRRLEALPYVKRASIATRFPHTVRIDLVERVPAVTFPGSDGRWRVLDDEGRVIDVIDGQPAKYPPIAVQGGSGPDLAAGQAAAPAYAEAGDLARWAPDEIRSLIQSFAVDQAGQLSMTLKGGTVVEFGQPVEMVDKLIVTITKLRMDTLAKTASLNVSNWSNPTSQFR